MLPAIHKRLVCTLISKYLEAGFSLFHAQLFPGSILVRLIHSRHGIAFVSGRRYILATAVRGASVVRC